jgi:hypothetical protein
MALIAGAGNPLGSGGTAGTGSSLNYVGNHVYAYSGLFEFDNSGFKAGLSFTTGANYQTVKIYWGYPETSGDNIQSQVYLNDEKIYAQFHNNTHADFTVSPMTLRILIPPFTKVEIGAINGDGNVRDCLVTYSGRVYA